MSDHQKAAIVTGAGRGLGLAAARELHARGYRLALLSPSGAAEVAARELGAIGRTGSVTNQSDLAALVAEAHSTFGRIDAVVNSTGNAPVAPSGELLDLSEHNWYVGTDMVFLNVVRMARLVTPIMAAQGGGAFVNISTFAALEPDPTYPVSSCMRAALAGYTKLFADRFAALGIRMNNVLPGMIDNYPADAADSGCPLWRGWRGRQDDRVSVIR